MAQLLFPLADERAVIRYDQLGSGRSGRPTDRTLWQRDRFVAELQALREEILGYELYRGTLVAEDGSAATMVVSIWRRMDTADRKCSCGWF